MTLQQNHITIRRTACGWTADYRYHDVMGPEVYDAFGAYIIPLPYTTQATAAIVRADQQARFPASVVHVEV